MVRRCLPTYLINRVDVDALSDAITAFDDAIAGDVLELFPGGIESLPGRTDEEIQEVVNDFGDGSSSSNYQKARLCLYGTTALVALVDPAHENLWVANLGDCEATKTVWSRALQRATGLY